MSRYYNNYTQYLGAQRCCDVKVQGPQGAQGLPGNDGPIGPVGPCVPVNFAKLKFIALILKIQCVLY